MGIFESNYRHNVITELERRTRELEFLKDNDFDDKISQFHSILDFIKQAKLLKDTQIEFFFKRSLQILHQKDYENSIRENSENLCDGYTNPIEMAKKFNSLDEMHAELYIKSTNSKKEKECFINNNSDEIERC